MSENSEIATVTNPMAELAEMLKLRAELDPGAPSAAVVPTSLLPTSLFETVVSSPTAATAEVEEAKILSDAGVRNGRVAGFVRIPADSDELIPVIDNYDPVFVVKGGSMLVTSPAEPTYEQKLKGLIDAQIAAVAEDRASNEAFQAARARKYAAIKIAEKTNAELAKFLGYPVKAAATAATPTPAAKKKLKRRVPLVPYRTSLSGRERLILAVGVRPMSRVQIERCVRPLGCGTAATGLDGDGAFKKAADLTWDLTGHGRSEFAALSQTEDGKRFLADCRKNVETVFGKSVPMAAATPKVAAGTIENTADLAVVALGVQKMTPGQMEKAIRALFDKASGGTLYGTYKVYFEKDADDRYRLSPRGLARHASLMASPDGQAARKKVQDYLLAKK